MMKSPFRWCAALAAFACDGFMIPWLYIQRNIGIIDKLTSEMLCIMHKLSAVPEVAAGKSPPGDGYAGSLRRAER